MVPSSNRVSFNVSRQILIIMATKRTSSGLRSWVEHNSSLAQQVLTPPPPPPNLHLCGGTFLQSPSATNNEHIVNTLDKYLHYRNWAIPYHNTLDKEASISLVSYPLTYPLTLGYFYCTKIMDTKRIAAQYGTAANPIRICCVGARAEATLPEPFWKELLISTFPLSWHVSFIGPDVIIPKEQCKIIKLVHKVGSNGDSDNERQFLRLSFYRCYFEDYIATVTNQNNNTTTLPSEKNNHEGVLPSIHKVISDMWSGAVLFNPGFGHTYLQKKWVGTMQLLIQSNIPLLITAHNQADCDRDLQALNGIVPTVGSTNCDNNTSQNRICLPLRYMANPWSSQLDVVDPLNPTATQSVRTNSHVLIFLKRLMCNLDGCNYNK